MASIIGSSTNRVSNPPGTWTVRAAAREPGALVFLAAVEVCVGGAKRFTRTGHLFESIRLLWVR